MAYFFMNRTTRYSIPSTSSVTAESFESAIRDTLEKDYKEKERKLEQKHNDITKRHWIGYIVSMSIMALSVIGVLIISKPLQDEMREFFTRVFEVVGSIIIFPVNTGKFIAIDVLKKAVNSNGYIACMAITCTILYVIMIAVALLAGRFLYRNIIEYLCDGVTVAVLIITNAVIVFFTPVLTEIIPINLLYLNVWIIVGYVVYRFLQEWDMEQTKKQVLLWILIFQVIVLFMKGIFWIAR